MRNNFKTIFSKMYVFLFAVSIFPLLIFTTPSIVKSSPVEILFWVIVMVIADLKVIKRPGFRKTTEVSMVFAMHLSAIIVLGTKNAVWTVIIAAIIVEFKSQRQLHKKLFNIGQLGFTTLVSGYTFYYLKLSSSSVFFNISDLPAVLAAEVVYSILNLFLVAVVIYLTADIKIHDFFVSGFKIKLTHFYTLIPICLAMVLIYNPKYPFIILIFLPHVLVSSQVLRKYFDIQLHTQQTLNVIAEIIDKRDKYTFSHSMRVAEYSKKIAQSLSLKTEKIYEIEMAGQVHDLGKIAIEDSILRKEGKLTDEEFSQIKRHPEVGFDLLKDLKHYKNCANFVLYHHERLDGKGYPRKLTRYAIPLGAKILAVADSYDAMTSDRPYRKALSQTSAIEELLKNSGTQFDPEVVKTFIHILEEEYDYEGIKLTCS